MKQEIAEQWVKALRSGKYKQAKGQLKFGDSFCCLGVLCDISGQGNWEDDNNSIFTRYYIRDIDDGHDIDLPGKVMRWAGMISELGFIQSLGEVLAELNDDGASFEEIADFIEGHWKEL